MIPAASPFEPLVTGFPAAAPERVRCLFISQQFYNDMMPF